MKSMKNIEKLFKHELFLYILAGGLTTLFYFVLRIGLFHLMQNIFLVTLLANTCAILFAFILNDILVFKQPTANRFIRLVKFFFARISTLILDVIIAYFLIELFPSIIGQFVQNNIHTVNAIVTLLSQILILIVNYILSKWFIFNDTSQTRLK